MLENDNNSLKSQSKQHKKGESSPNSPGRESARDATNALEGALLGGNGFRLVAPTRNAALSARNLSSRAVVVSVPFFHIPDNYLFYINSNN